MSSVQGVTMFVFGIFWAIDAGHIEEKNEFTIKKLTLIITSARFV